MRRRESEPTGEADVPSEGVRDAVSEVATVETWATRKGMIERFGAPSGQFQIPNPEYVKWACARAFRAWPIGFETTEADFDKAVADAMGATHG